MYRFPIDKIWQHLRSNGFWEKYTCWLYHGETSSGGPHDHGQFYLDDLAKGDAWKVVNLVHPRNIYRAATLGEAEDEEEDVAYQEPNAIGIPNSSTIRLNNFKTGRSVRIRDEEPRLVDVDPNQETDEDSGDEEIHILPEINSDTEEDSSDDSDYEP
ncbi:hypothetical protein ACLB2K_064213 [Fragaria x ananassa]